MGKNAVILIDFEPEVSDQLQDIIGGNPCLDGVQVETWPGLEYYPRDFFLKKTDRLLIGQKSILDDFYRFMKKNNPVFVVVNYDYAFEERRTDIIGYEVRKWCQRNVVPFAEYSRVLSDNLPHSQSLFGLHVPILENSKLNFKHVFDLVSGFDQIKKLIENIVNVNKLTYTEILYELFDKNCREYEISQYFSPFFVNNFNLIESISHRRKCNKSGFSKKERINILTYVVGHVIVNSILKFPGPIISDQALCAYVSLDYKSSSKKLNRLFGNATYDGPFNGLGTYFWKKLVDDKILKLINKLDDADKFKDSIESTRLAIEKQTGRLEKWNCKNCKGKRGGYFCPYSEKTVCEYCSESSSSWIPRGPNICRVETEYYKHWMPFLSN